MTVQLLDIVTQKQLNEEPCVLIDDKRPRLTEDPKAKTDRERAFPLVQPIRFDQLIFVSLDHSLEYVCRVILCHIVIVLSLHSKLCDGLFLCRVSSGMRGYRISELAGCGCRSY